MIRKIGMFVLALSALVACSKPENFVIKGTIQGKADGDITLMKFDGTKWATEDSAKVVDGKFELTGKTDLPELRIIAMGPQTVVAQFFAENGKITVDAYIDSLDKTVVKGSKSNEDFKIFNKELSNLSKEAQEMQQRYMQAQMTGDQDGMQKAQIDFEAMMQNQSVYAKNFIREHPKSAVSPLVALMQFAQEMSAHDIDTLIAFLDPTIQPSIYVGELKKIADRARVTDIGSVAPEITLNDPDGNPFSLSSLRGKYVLLDFWAAWCQPCRRENPNVVALYNQYKDKGFDILGVSLDRTKEDWVKAIADDKLTWHHVSDLKFWQSEAAQKYNVQSIPFTLLLDKEGKIIAKNLRGEALAAKLAELMGQ